MELEGCCNVVFAVVREDIEECSDVVERLASYVGDLEDGADTGGDELSLSTGDQQVHQQWLVRVEFPTAVFIHSSLFLMKMGIFRAPGDLRIFVN